MRHFPLFKATQDFLARRHGHFINGKWQQSASGKTFAIHDPATGDLLGHCAAGEAPEIDAAVKAARAAFEGPWSKFTASQRSAVLWKVADLVQVIPGAARACFFLQGQNCMAGTRLFVHH